MEEQDNTKQVALGSLPVGKLLMQYAIPSIIGMTATSLYNMVDSIFIGQGCGPMAIAGLSVCFPLMNLSAAFGAMVGIGSSTVIAIKLGQRDKEGAEMTLGNVVLLNVVISLVFMGVSLLFLDEILTFFGASEVTLPYAKEYMGILLFGNVLTHLYLGLNDAVRSSGYPIKAMIATVTAVVINTAFDYLFIMVFGLGIAGAAIGTLCAQLVAFCLIMYHFLSKETYLRFRRGIFRFRAKIVKAILSIGIAPFAINSCACLVVLLINNGLKDQGGDYYVGAYGIANRIIFIFIMIAQGINQGMQPIVGFNYGAEQLPRSIKTYKYASIVACCVTALCFILGQFFPVYVVRLFTTDEEMIGIACHALGIMTTFFPFIGFQMTSTGLFMALQMAQKSIFLALTRQLIFLVPFLIVLPRFYGTDGVWYAMPTADVFSITVVAVMVFTQLRKFKRQYNK